MKRYFQLMILGVCFLFLNSCQESATKQTFTSGVTKILVDETFKPIVEDQLYIFESSYPNAKIELITKPENELLKLFLNDSVQIAILSRIPEPNELRTYTNKNVKIRSTRFAIDAIALVTSKSTKDSVVDLETVLKLMKGDNSGVLKGLVFDNANSSTVRYLRDLAKVRNLPAKGIYALKSNSEVLNYVYNNPGTIGVIGINWIEQPEKSMEQVVSQLKVLGVKNLPGKPGSDQYYKPNQNNLALGLYPLSRDIYIVNCQGGPGLGEGFANFIAGERGQRIVLKSGLLPDSIPPREVIVRK